MNTLLKNTNEISWTGRTIYRLTRKLTPYEWNAVKKHFIYFKQDNYTGWGTFKPIDTVKAHLRAVNDTEYVSIENKIIQAEKDRTNCNGYLEAEEYNGLITNLKHEKSKIVHRHIQN